MSEDWIIERDGGVKEVKPTFSVGRHEGISNEIYHSSEGYSNSFLTALLRSPAHAVSRGKWKSTRNMEIGSAFHVNTLEPDLFQSDYRVIECDVRTSTLYKQAIKNHPSALVLTTGEHETVKGMTAGVYREPKLREIIELPGKSEVAFYAKDPETGLLIKCKFDWLTDCAQSLDLKKTQDARRYKFSSSINMYMYHMQDAFYRHVYKCATGEELQQFYFGAVEEMKPHAARRWKLGPESRARGDSLFREALTTLAICLDRDEFPAYDGEEDDEIEIPNYALEQNDEIEIEFGGEE
ncbi:Exodeoxyribonuclease 8 [compost metagenome]